MSGIMIEGAREGNLKGISLELPRGQLIVFTGLSGSGKTTLALDVLFQECQRQYLEAIGLQGIRKPKVEAVRHVSPAIFIGAGGANCNPRSTVGTITDIYTDLRMVYEKLGVRDCPFCGAAISSADCRETVVKHGDEYQTFMDCCVCGRRMEKLTRTHFSFNTREGACATCAGLGRTMTIREGRVIHAEKSLEDGAVDFWEQKYKEYQIGNLHSAFGHFGVPVKPGTPVASFSAGQRAILLQGVESEAVRQAFPDLAPPKTVAGGRFEGVFTMLWRKLSEQGGDPGSLADYFDEADCPACGGERLADAGRHVTVAGTRLPQLSLLSLEELQVWVQARRETLDAAAVGLVEPYLVDLETKIQRLVRVGLGYLSLDRQTLTLSGGELQRVRLAAALDSDLTGILYILDEPTIGLHPRDTDGMVSILKRLRDAGNTVLVIEHDPDVMQAADLIVDIGPGSGRHGGEVVARGTLDELLQQAASVTGAWLRGQRQALAARQEQGFPEPAWAAPHPAFRTGSGEGIHMAQVTKHNLKGIAVDFPTGCLTVVTGVSGSGKSTLVLDVLAEAARRPEAATAGAGTGTGGGSGGGTGAAGIAGLSAFDQVVTIEQAAITRMKRSSVATYCDAYSEIRKVFGSLPEAQARNLSARSFSFNLPGGRCERCEGLGTVTSSMLFFQDIEVTCPVCGGRQFSDDVLAVEYRGHSIRDVLKMSVEEARALFCDHRTTARILGLLEDVGLGYLELGQSVKTLSGGEGQRLKLARELTGSRGKRTLYLMDEPTTGLHPVDVEHFLAMLARLVDAGHTVIVVEHNLQVIRAADWIIDLGPGGGVRGGEVVFTGTPLDLLRSGRTATADYLRRAYGEP